MWRFWRALPPKGKIGILFGSWYTDADHRARDRATSKRAELEQPLERIRHFERMLAARGRADPQVLVPPLEEGAEEAPQGARADPKTRWRVHRRDWEHFKHYDASSTV